MSSWWAASSARDGVVEKLNRKFPVVQEEEDTFFPTLPGSPLHPTFPTLEFVKAVSKVSYSPAPSAFPLHSLQ